MDGLIQKMKFRRIVKSIIRQINLIFTIRSVYHTDNDTLRKNYGIKVFSDDCPICNIGKNSSEECSVKCFLSSNHGCQEMFTMPKDRFSHPKLMLRQEFWIEVLEFINHSDSSIFKVKNRSELHKKLKEIDYKFIVQ